MCAAMMVQERVQSIVEEAYHDDYWVSASRDGNRASHYTGVA